MNITIVGAGNVGTQFAVHAAEKGHKVIIYGSKPEKIQKELIIVNEDGNEIHKGIIDHATNDPCDAFEDSDVIFITMPAPMMGLIAEKIEPFIKRNVKICLVPGTGGGECAFKRCIEKGATLFGLQRVPSVARLLEYGRRVRAVGYRSEMYAAAIPQNETQACCNLVMELFEIPCTSLSNYLNITLTPSNPILHTTRLKSLFHDYKDGVIYERVPLFYEEWDDTSSELLLKCDEELQSVCKKIEEFDLSYVKSLKIHYESPTIEAMTAKIRSITGFKGLASPVIKVKDGYIPDLTSRYFTADFPYGLSILVQIADLVDLQVPNMRETLEWYYSLVGKQKGFCYGDFGIKTYEDFVKFYAR